MKNKPLSRRTFLDVSATVACTVAALGAPGILLANPLDNPLEGIPVLKGYEPKINSIWVRQDDKKNAFDNLKKLIESATDFSWLSKGDTILIKLALNSGNEFPATSDPSVLNCLVKVLKEKGAGKIFACDQSGVEHVQFSATEERGSSRQLCDTAGLLTVITENDIIPIFFEENGLESFFESSPKGAHHWKKPLFIPSAIKAADHIIYLPRVSSHVMADITSGFKIGVGFLRDDSRHELHRNGKHFYEMYEEINQIPEISNKLRLTITSGRKVFSTFGPDKGHLCQPDHGLIMASEDLLANELLSYAWLQWNRECNTPFYSKMTTGQITKLRSGINKGFVWKFWDNPENTRTSSIPMFSPGNIYAHPAIVNYMKRKGGKPEKIQWQSLNNNPDESVSAYLEKQMNG
ncbi:MAG: DUF362 domain-containing protein [Desulfatibacillum sp.]|nr:DUF362 domain-containing protein [Desulfatibacillum sp.]